MEAGSDAAADAPADDDTPPAADAPADDDTPPAALAADDAADEPEVESETAAVAAGEETKGENQ